MHSIEWLENGREFVPIIDGGECPLPDPRSMDFQTVLSILEAEDIVDCVQPMRLAEWKRELVFNRPRALRDHSEKVAICEFPQFTPATLISLKWDGFIEKPATKQAAVKPAVKTESK